jgi:hypothetical protein
MESWGRGCIAPQFMTLTLDEVNGQLEAPAALTQGKSPRYPFIMRLGGPQSLSGSCGEETNSSSVRIRSLAVQLVVSSYND